MRQPIDDEGFTLNFKVVKSQLFDMSNMKSRKFGPLRCEDCGRFVKATQLVTHDFECPNWKPYFAQQGDIEWIVKYTNPCGEEPLD